LKYLGIDPPKPRIGFFDFTCCEGCQLQLTNKEATLVDFLSLIEVVNFREVSSSRDDEYDIALVEGAVSRADEVERLKKIRAKAKILVAYGSCACFGGVNVLKNRFTTEDVVAEVYGKHKVETQPVKKISDLVKVDLEIPGCPVSKAEVEKIIVNLVTGAEITFPNYPVCMECKANNNVCVIDLGQICLGPITRGGCGAPCPTGNFSCLGCRGPAPDANFESFLQIMDEKGFSRQEVNECLDFFGAFSGVTT
jgi:sulfhydrogenase subunit delta